VVRWFDVKLDSFSAWGEAAQQHIEEVVREKEKKVGKAIESRSKKETIFRHLINDDSLDESDWSVERLTKEAQILMGAGSVSPARTCHFIAFYLLSNNQMRQRLEGELESVMASWPEIPPTWAQLEKLPYLQAVIKEGLRHSYGTMHRLPRISSCDVQYNKWTIPAGVSCKHNFLSMFYLGNDRPYRSLCPIGSALTQGGLYVGSCRYDRLFSAHRSGSLPRTIRLQAGTLARSR
jgi:cytochrome P450